jgi:serine/threonine-protein kinase RsbW
MRRTPLLGEAAGFWYAADSAGIDEMDMVRLSVPGTLQYRDVVLRVVASVCRLLRSGVQGEQEADHRKPVADFDDKIVSAVGEAFNNIAIHGYSGGRRGNAALELAIDRDLLTIRLVDTGDGFEPADMQAPDMKSLPESHMGLVIMRECMDEVSYVRGVAPAPNVLTLTKRYFVGDAPARSASS